MMYVRVEMDDLIEIEKALGMAKDKSKMVLRTAINNAAKKTEKSMIDGANKKYRYKKGKKDIRKANSVRKAKARDLSALVEARGPLNELMDFRVTPMVYVPGGGYPEWYKARVLKGGKLKKIALRPDAAGDKYKGFIIQYKSGHYALAQRVPGKRMKSNPKKEAVKSLLSLCIPKAEEVVFNEQNMSEQIYDQLQESIQEQIHRFFR